MNIPKKITPCPIVEAAIGIKFESNVPSDAVFGILYGRVKEDFNKQITSLPILQIPEAIRNQDPQLRYQPYYKLKNGNFVLQIGPRYISFSSTKEYVGWDEFSKQMNRIIKFIAESGIIKTLSKLSIRYINFFDFNVYDKINLKLQMEGHDFNAKQTTLKSIMQTGDFISILQILNKSNIIIDGTPKSGSVIDIDTYLESAQGIPIGNISSLLNQAHIEEKILFFSLLNNEYLNSLNPEY